MSSNSIARTRTAVGRLVSDPGAQDQDPRFGDGDMKTKSNSPDAGQNDVADAQAAFVHRVASILSRENISLQAGNFETADDINARRDAIRTFNF